MRPNNLTAMRLTFDNLELLMNYNIKEVIWKFLVAGLRCFPDALLLVICRLIFARFSNYGEPIDGLKHLYEIETGLRWFIDQQAIRYGNGIHPKHDLMRYHDFFVERISSTDSVLDVGCGIGAVTASVGRTGASVVGIDLDCRNIENATSMNDAPGIRFICGDILVDPPDESFSVIIMSNVLEHIEDRITILERLIKLYHPRKILIRVPMINRHWSVALRRDIGIDYFSDPSHCIEYTEELFEEEIRNAGLIVSYRKVIWGEIWAEVQTNA